MSRNNCPVPFTCPTIDTAIEDAEKALDYIDNAYTHIKELLGKRGTLEELRDQNTKLRAWGESLQDEIEELLTEREELENRIIYLENKYE